MSRVYVAESLASEVRKLVVLKVLHRELAADPDMRAAFLREAALSARLNHPNIVQVFEVLEDASAPMIVMQYLDGIALTDVLRRAQDEMPLRLHLHVLTQVLAGLHYFHELKGPDDALLNCVHRDVSPHNVLVLHEGGVKVVDFGIAKVQTEAEPQTPAGIVKGKIRYMAPEQLLGSAGIDRRADVYAVGVMAWEAIAKRRMWGKLDAAALIQAIIRGQTPNLREVVPNVSPELAAIVERALALDRNARYPTADAMRRELQQFMRAADAHTSARRLADFMRRRFADDRRNRQTAIAVALRAPRATTSSGGVFDPSRPVAIAADWPVSAPHWSTQRLISSLTRVPPAVRPYLVAVAVALLVAAGASSLLSLISHVHAPTATRGIPPKADQNRMVTIRVQAKPEGAEVFLDGARLGPSPYQGTHAARGRDATLEVRAPGFLTETYAVRLEGDITLTMTLQPAPTALGEALAGPEAESEPSMNARRERAARLATRSRAVPESAAPASEPDALAAGESTGRSKPQRPDCNPPYTIDRDGVKTFNPECF